MKRRRSHYSGEFMKSSYAQVVLFKKHSLEGVVGGNHYVYGFLLWVCFGIFCFLINSRRDTFLVYVVL